jgi:glycosyltransferase involved in cell wall biosynthesis
MLSIRTDTVSDSVGPNKRVLCVIDSLGSGGAQRQMSYLATSLKQLGHYVELFVWHKSHDHFSAAVQAAGIPVRGLEKEKKGFSLEVLFALSKKLKCGFDAIISFQTTANTYVSLARLLSADRFTVHLACERTSALKARTVPELFQLAFSGMTCSFLVANSYHQAARLQRWPGLQKKVHVIWNGFPRLDHDRTAPRTSSGVFRFLVVGRVSPEKNGARLLEALKALVDSGFTEFKLSWAGRQDNSHGALEERRRMEEILRASPVLSDRVSFLGEVRNIDQHLASSDALILPSLFEGLPNAVCEAMFAGCPVLVSDVCDNPLLLGNGERGILFDPSSPFKIAEAIREFCEMSETARKEMADRAVSFAEARLGTDVMVRQYLQLIEKRGMAKSIPLRSK